MAEPWPEGRRRTWPRSASGKRTPCRRWADDVSNMPIVNEDQRMIRLLPRRNRVRADLRKPPRLDTESSGSTPPPHPARSQPASSLDRCQDVRDEPREHHSARTVGPAQRRSFQHAPAQPRQPESIEPSDVSEPITSHDLAISAEHLGYRDRNSTSPGTKDRCDKGIRSARCFGRCRGRLRWIGRDY